MKKYLILLLLLILCSASFADAKTATYTGLASTDDSGDKLLGGDASEFMWMPFSNNTRAAYTRWNIKIPTGATISSASVSFTVAPIYTGTAHPVSIDLVTIADCPAVTSNSSGWPVSGSPVSDTFTGTWSSGNTVTSPDITSLIEAYVALEGYQSGQYIGLKYVNPGATSYSAVGCYDSGKPAALSIVYTGGNAFVEMVMAEPHVKTKQYIELNIWNQDAGDVLYIYLDNAEVESLRYTIQAGDVPANAATAFQKTVLMDYTGLHAGTHHIDVVLKTSGGDSRMGTQVEGKDLKTWTTTHDHYPLVGINENNAVCIANDEDTACTPYFPLAPFMWDADKFDSCGWKATVNGADVQGWASSYTAASWDSYLDSLSAVTDTESGLTFKGIGPGRNFEFSVTYSTSTGNLTDGEAVTWVNGEGQVAGQGFVYFTGTMASPVAVWSTLGRISPGYVITGTSSGKSITASSGTQYAVMNNLITSVVTANKAHASMLIWKFEDEPELRAFEVPGIWTPAQSEAVAYANYLKVKTIDTDHPHSVGHYGYSFPEGATSNQYALAYSYLTGKRRFIADITGGDIYPYEFAYEGTGIHNGIPVSLESALSADDSYIAYNYGLIPHFAIVQPTDEKTCQTIDATGHCTAWAEGSTRQCPAGSGPLGTNTWTPDPTAAQIKNELWLRVIHGASGIVYFNYFCPVLDYQIAEMGAFKTLLESGVNATDPLAPIILSAKSSKYTPVTRTVGAYTVALNHGTVTAGTDGRVDYMIREYAGSTWVFAARVKKISGETFSACNTTGTSAGAVRCTEGATYGVWPDSTNTNTKSATIPVTGLANSTTVARFGEGTNLTSGDGTITDNFTDYGVHIYKIGGSATTFNLTVTKAGDGSGTVTSSPAGIDCGATCVYAFVSGATVTLTASVVGNNALGAWSGGGCSGNGATCEVTVTEATEVTKSFTDTTPRNFNVTVRYAGTGTGTTSPAAGIAAYANGATATTTQTPGANATFSGWSGTCGCTGTGSCAPTISADCTIIATWADEAQYQLLVDYPQHGEVVVSDVAGINCGGGNLACIANYYSQVVTLTTTCPSGFMSPTYSGDCTGSTCTPTMSADKQVAVSCACASCFTLGSGGTATLGTGGSGGGQECNSSTDKVGTSDTSGALSDLGKDTAWCSLFTPSCYGPLKTGYIAHGDTNASSVKVCVYSDDGDGIAGSGDLKVGCSGDISSSSVEVASAAMDGGSVTSGSYWVCSFVKADATNVFSVDKDSLSATVYYRSASGYYATPPANLGGMYNHATLNNRSAYISVGP